MFPSGQPNPKFVEQQRDSGVNDDDAGAVHLPVGAPLDQGGRSRDGCRDRAGVQRARRFRGRARQNDHRGNAGLARVEPAVAAELRGVVVTNIFRKLPPGVGPDTLAVQGGVARSAFQETSEGLFLTSGYIYDSRREAERAFNGEEPRFVYSRFGNPTVAMFQERLRLLDRAEACFGTASGMAAVFVSLARY